MRKGDIIIIIAVTVLAFPILYVAMLFATGTMRIEYGINPVKEEKIAKVEEVRSNARRDSLAAQNSKVFQAIEQERADLMREQERLTEQYARLEMLQAQIEAQREELASERKKLETKVESMPDTEEARFKKLAKIYEAMKPAEAAGILEPMPDAQVAAIISRMNDDRQKARILAALSKEKTARVNKLIK